MYKVYYLVSYSTDWYYIGITKNSLRTRFNQHKFSARKGIKTPLYDCMRKYDDFLIVLKEECLTHEECCLREVELIAEAKNLNHKILNLAVGGEGGFHVTDTESWKIKLREKRKGRKPFLGCSHSEETKELCAKASQKFWDNNKKYSPEDIKTLSFKDAKALYGISKTHYYRLKRGLPNE